MTLPIAEIHYSRRYVNCLREIVNQIPFYCSKVYAGQYGRCVNTRLGEHALSLQSSPFGYLSIRVRDCRCKPLFTHTQIPKRFHGKQARELFKAQVILSKGENYVSAPSLVLSAKKLQYLSLRLVYRNANSQQSLCPFFVFLFFSILCFFNA